MYDYFAVILLYIDMSRIYEMAENEHFCYVAFLYKIVIII